MDKADIQAISAQFALPGPCVAAEPFEAGHINQTFRISTQAGPQCEHYLLQRLNERVFPAPQQVMENIARVTSHIGRKLSAAGVPDAARRVLTLVTTRDGTPYHRDAGGGYWRMYRYIGGTATRLAVRTPDEAEQAGRAFGGFQSWLSDLPAPRLHETIPHFHDTPRRYAAFLDALEEDPCRRVAAAAPEVELARHYRPLADTLVRAQRSGEFPERIVHNDAKITNVLLDEQTGEGLCVIDLDTVMPGLALYDFGDMVRTMTTTTAEDEPDPGRVELEIPLFAALLRGYVGASRAFLTVAEREHLLVAGKVITYEQALRFLTDYLLGDVYYRSSRPDHNLVRCRTQLKLLQSLERHEAALTECIARI
jgi:Ser/Thr protein kinase RdoA (MazF antagonist)